MFSAGLFELLENEIAYSEIRVIFINCCVIFLLFFLHVLIMFYALQYIAKEDLFMRIMICSIFLCCVLTCLMLSSTLK